MTPLNNHVTRRTNAALDGSFGRDKYRPLVVTLIPGTDDVPDLLEVRPYGTRRAERIAICDIYRLAIRARVANANLERARVAKARKAAARESRALDRAAKKLKQPI